VNNQPPRVGSRAAEDACGELEEEEATMDYAFWSGFATGVFLGTAAGVVLMCLLGIEKCTDCITKWRERNADHIEG
jgi:hypothetical protein